MLRHGSAVECLADHQDPVSAINSYLGLKNIRIDGDGYVYYKRHIVDRRVYPYSSDIRNQLTFLMHCCEHLENLGVAPTELNAKYKWRWFCYCSPDDKFIPVFDRLSLCGYWVNPKANQWILILEDGVVVQGDPHCLQRYPSLADLADAMGVPRSTARSVQRLMLDLGYLTPDIGQRWGDTLKDIVGIAMAADMRTRGITPERLSQILDLSQDT